MTTQHPRRSLVLLATAALAAGGLPALLATPASAATSTAVEVVADGLHNPRGLAFAPDGTLYVAESGQGGDGPCVGSPEQGGEVCYGPSGAVTEVEPDGTQSRLSEGLPSIAGDSGDEATGPSDVSVAPDGTLQVVIGLGADEETRDDLGGFGDDFGRLVSIDPSTGDATFGADLAAYEYANDPVEGTDPETGEPAPPDSNPYAVHAVEGRTFVADAGGNDLLSVHEDGTIALEAVFPTREVDAPPFLGAPPGTKIPMESVPTSISVDGEGGLRVGELTGFPFPVGAANIYAVDTGADPSEAAQVELEGFTNTADVVERDGDVFVLEFAHNSLMADNPYGALTRLRPDGTRQLLLQDELFFPGGMALHPTDGSLYITNQGVSGTDGEVLRIDPSLAGDPAIQQACPPDDAAGPTYRDIEQTVHEEAIACLTWFDIANGTSATRFSPEGTLTRAQVATLLASVIDASIKDLPDATTDKFTDDDESVHEANINRLAQAGIVSGRTATTFGPDDPVKRDELAAFAVRTYAYITGEQLTAGPNAFDDDDASVHEPAINRAAREGLINGVAPRTFNPYASITRGQSSSVLARLLSSLVEAGDLDRPPAV